MRWCSDALEVSCDNREKVRVASTLDCRERVALGHVATLAAPPQRTRRTLMVAIVVIATRLYACPSRSSGWVMTAAAKRHTTPVTLHATSGWRCAERRNRPQFHSMAEALVCTLKSDCFRMKSQAGDPNRHCAAAKLAHYNEVRLQRT